MKTENAPVRQSSSSLFATLLIPVALVVAILLFNFVMGSGTNFEGGDSNNHPLPGNYLGMVYKGGYIVPLLMASLLIVVAVSIERFLTLSKATGSGSLDAFMGKIHSSLSSNNIDSAIAECDKQKGSVGNVIKSTLSKYKEMITETAMDKEQKLAAISKEAEETTSLEMPVLNKNLSILSTLASVATLVALLGTVLGMIKAFSAMSSAGAPDASALATGISEALINTAIGIGTSAVSIIFYNYFTGKIDTLAYSIDEAVMTITSTFSTNHK